MSTAEERYLLDTHTFVWMASAPERLGASARERIGSPASELLLSVASVWEMAIEARRELAGKPWKDRCSGT